jgi:hypothetical protein
MSQHYDPVQAGFILDSFARDEMLFGVAQRGSSKNGVKKSAAGEPTADDCRWLRLVNSLPAQSINNSKVIW